jgi:hypothetical protein
MRLEDLQPNASVRGILPDALATIVNTQWFGSEALELTYKDPSGREANQLLYRHDEPRLEIVELGRPWSFDGDGALFRLVSEAQRIRLTRRASTVRDNAVYRIRRWHRQVGSMLPRRSMPARRGGWRGMYAMSATEPYLGQADTATPCVRRRPCRVSATRRGSAERPREGSPWPSAE